MAKITQAVRDRCEIKKRWRKASGSKVAESVLVSRQALVKKTEDPPTIPAVHGDIKVRAFESKVFCGITATGGLSVLRRFRFGLSTLAFCHDFQ